MNRKEFLKSCATGLCGCAAASLVPLTDLHAADAPKTEDWKQPFVKARYAKMLEILSSKMDDKSLNEVLHDVGTYCSTTSDEWTKKYRGDFDGFCKAIKQGVSGDTVTFDREKQIITMASDERADCFCPLNGENTPKVVCNCSLGWQQHTWETLLQKKVRVELKESVLRGGKRCVFEIQVQTA